MGESTRRARSRFGRKACGCGRFRPLRSSLPSQKIRISEAQDAGRPGQTTHSFDPLFWAGEPAVTVFRGGFCIGAEPREREGAAGDKRRRRRKEGELKIHFLHVSEFQQVYPCTHMTRELPGVLCTHDVRNERFSCLALCFPSRPCHVYSPRCALCVHPPRDGKNTIASS